MLSTVVTTIGKLAAATARATHRATSAVVEGIQDLWRAHGDLVTTNPAYAAVLATAAAGLVTQVHLDRMLIIVVSAAVAIYAALRQPDMDPDPPGRPATGGGSWPTGTTKRSRRDRRRAPLPRSVE